MFTISFHINIFSIIKSTLNYFYCGAIYFSQTFLSNYLILRRKFLERTRGIIGFRDILNVYPLIVWIMTILGSKKYLTPIIITCLLWCLNIAWSNQERWKGTSIQYSISMNISRPKFSTLQICAKDRYYINKDYLCEKNHRMTE